jgi:O-acetyl-ADP-ribose deacetylase (regulator of RNase III)
MSETKKFLETDSTIEKIVFVCFGESVLKTYEQVFQRVFGVNIEK